MVATSDLIQVFGISIGAIFALLTLLIGVFIWMVNRQDKTNERRHSETKESVASLEQETKESIDNLRQETREEFAKVRQETREEFANLRQETREEFAKVRQETKEEFAKVRQETKEEFAKVRQETKEEFAKVRAEMNDGLTNVRTEMAQQFQRQNEENERRHQEVMKAIGLLYQHTHGPDGRMIIPIDGADLVAPPTVPAPADD